MRYFTVLLLSILLAGCFSADNVSYQRMENVKLKKAGLVNLIVVGDAVLKNDNKMGVTIQKIDADVLIDDKKVGKMNQNISVEMPKLAEFKLPLEFDIPISAVLENANDIFKNLKNNKKVNVQLDGTITIDVLGKPIDVSFNHAEQMAL